jgi:hypothetical protein
MQMWGGLARLRIGFPPGPAGRRPACLLLSAITLAARARAQPPASECELASCVQLAYLVRAGPAWLPDAPHGPLPTPLPSRNQSSPFYALVASKSGPKLHKAEPGGNTSMQGENGAFVFHGTSMPQLAEDLSTLSQVDRPVLDRTGIPGGFDFNLKFGESNDERKRVLDRRRWRFHLHTHPATARSQTGSAKRAGCNAGHRPRGKGSNEKLGEYLTNELAASVVNEVIRRDRKEELRKS